MKVAIERARTGRRRWAAAGRTLTRAGTAGPNRLAFSGRTGRAKLRPGAYRARFVATDAAGNRSAGATIRFRIARR